MPQLMNDMNKKALPLPHTLKYRISVQCHNRREQKKIRKWNLISFPSNGCHC